MQKKIIHALFFGLLIFSATSCGITRIAGLMPEIGICTRFTNGELMHKAGYSYVEEGVSKFLVPTKSEAEFDSIMYAAANYPLPVKACNSFIPGDLKSVGPQPVHVHILEFVETALRRAKKSGVEIIVFGSGGSRSIPDGFSRDEARRQFVDLSRKMAVIAKKYDVTIVLEPLNTTECNFINSVAEGGEIVKDVNHPNFMLLADIYHMKMDNESPENIVKYGKLIKHVHIAEKKDRAVPGTYHEDFRPYFEALKKIKYKGKISIEARWTEFSTEAPIAINAIKDQLTK